MTPEEIEQPDGPHTWPQTVENISCGMIMLAAFVAVLALCGYAIARPGR
jgi:hypothetical protein